jgi:16S rRNA (adenine1518-N6/adenine1519-N6)-dimethyltransferase
MQPLGQHFLKNKSAPGKIIAALELAPDDVIFEIGPGHGELTTPLAAACESLGCTIVAIEKDAELVGALKNSAALKNIPTQKNIEFVHGDVLKILAEEIKTLNPEHYKIVGNIPYYITGKLLRVISELAQKPERVVLMVQKEVAERICDVPPDMNRLAASVQFWAKPKIIATISKNDFSPPPKIDSAVIALTTKKEMPDIDAEKYYTALRAIFAQPRKTILNNIAAASKNAQATLQIGAKTGKTKEEITSTLDAIGVNPGHRPQNLSIEDIIDIARALKPDFWG